MNETSQTSDSSTWHSALVESTPYLRRIAARMLNGDDVEIDDAVQDTIEKCIVKAHEYNAAKGTVRTWAGMLLRGIIIDNMRKNRVNTNVETLTDDGDLTTLEGNVTTDGEVSAANAEDIAKQSTLEALLHVQLDKLPESQRIVLDLYYVQGLNDRQIAEKLGVALTSVNQKRQRALAMLRKRLSGG